MRNDVVYPPVECHIPAYFANVRGSKMRYLCQGEGDPILFIHGMPTSSYLWRNIIPVLSSVGRCIAVDLIGMGESDKPDIAYTVDDHINYLTDFISELDLKDITLVMHEWGSVLGFDFASRHSDRIKALAFYEAYLQPNTRWKELSLPVRELSTLLKRPEVSHQAVVHHNYLVKKLLPAGLLRSLQPEEMEAYEKPFHSEASRELLWQYVIEMMLDGEPCAQLKKIVTHYSRWLIKSDVPKLMYYALPGFITTIQTVQWAIEHLKHLEVVEIEDALHLAQESHPEVFAATLKEWYLSLS